MYRKVSEKIEPATPEDFRRYWALNKFVGQRRFRPNHAKSLVAKMRSGKLLFLWFVTAKLPSSETVLMNGQHSSHAGLEYGKAYIAIKQHFVCETDADAWELFAAIDNNKVRTLNDVITGSKNLLADERLRSIGNNAIYRTCISALKFTTGGPPMFTKTAFDNAAGIHLMIANSDLVAWASDFMHESWMRTTGVVAAMYATYQANLDKATIFWAGVRDGEQLTKGSPIKRLRDWLMIARASHNSMNRIRAEYITCICWWNSWISGVPRKSVRANTMDTLPTPLS